MASLGASGLLFDVIYRQSFSYFLNVLLGKLRSYVRNLRQAGDQILSECSHVFSTERQVVELS